MNNLYYSNPKFKIGDPVYHLYMCEGQRRRGKTTWWLQQCVLHYFETGKKFIYLRRKDVEMDLALEQGLFNGCREVPENKEFWLNYPYEKYVKGSIYLVDIDGVSHHVGYYKTLNNVKGVAIEDSDLILFDEYVALKRSEYKGGESGAHEPELFLRLLDTIYSYKEFWCIMLANRDTPSNPYAEYFRIPYNCSFHKDKSRSLWYEFDYSEATSARKEGTVIGAIAKGTAYLEYSKGLISLGEVDSDLISTKPSHAVQIYNIKILGKMLTLWLDKTQGVMYLTSDCKFNSSMPTISVTNTDMSVNTDFIRFNGIFMEVLRSYYGGGKMRFNSQDTASMLNIMLSLQ